MPYKDLDKKKETQRAYKANHKEKISTIGKRYYEKNKEKILLKRKQYVDENKDVIYAKNKEYRDTHKEDLAKQKTIYYQENREKFLEDAKIRQQNLTPRARLLHNISSRKRAAKTKETILPVLIDKLIKDSNNICFWCGCNIPNGKMHIDHLYPLSKGGEHKIVNLVVSCATCNIKKGAKDPETWLNKILNN